MCLVTAFCASAAVAQTEWEHVPLMRAWDRPALAVDPSAPRVILFGGGALTMEFSDQTWSWDGVAWRQLSPVHRPPARSAGACVLDTVRQRLLLHGGLTNNATLTDTWEWDGTDWQPRVTSNPAPFGTMAFDQARGRAVLLSATANPGTWEWDGTTWTQMPVAGTPPPAPAPLAYDPRRGRTVAFSITPMTNLPVTSEWDGTAWQTMATAVSPPPGALYSLSYDAASQRVVLYGGVRYPTSRSQFVAVADLWEWDGLIWRLRVPTGATPPPGGASIGFDPARGRLLVFRGETWEWNTATATWRRAANAMVPPIPGPVAHDAARGRTVLHYGGSPPNMFSGPGTPSATWEWDGTTWHPVLSGGGPPERESFALAAAPGWQILLFGGEAWDFFFNRTKLGDTWLWSGTTWTQAPVSGPSARSSAAMAFDPVRQQTLLFGGIDAQGSRNDTWIWNGAWTQLLTTTAPPAGTGLLAYDQRRACAVLRPDLTTGPTWEFDGSNWTPRASVHEPEGRVARSMTYDTARERVVLFTSRQRASVAWEWDGVDWQRRATVGKPFQATWSAYDEARQETVLTATSSGSDTWRYVSTRPGRVAAFGNACGGARAPVLDSAGRLPWLGGQMAVRLGNLDLGATGLLWLGSSDRHWLGLPLPLDLSPLGLTGCSVHASLVALAPFTAPNGSADLVFGIPGDPTLFGVTAYTQGLGTAPGTNPAGITTSNALALTIGER